MKTEYIIIGVVVFVVLFIIVYIRECINEKKGVDSEDMQSIRQIVAKLVPDAGSYTTAYAVWETIQMGGGGRRVTTTTRYWYYAVAFKPGVIHIIPLSFDGGDMSYGEPMCLTKENLGMVNAKEGDLWASFYDLEQKEIVSIIVGPSNTKEDKYHPVNIQQKAESEAFVNFVKGFMAEVNGYRQVTVSGKCGKPLKK